jgi:hypothetical protein
MWGADAPLFDLRTGDAPRDMPCSARFTKLLSYYLADRIIG